MTAGIWLAIAGLTTIWATWVWHRAVHEGKPRLWYASLFLAAASGIWHMATEGAASWAWALSAVGFICALVALAMFAARHSR